jgi:hypothetical protein
VEGVVALCCRVLAGNISGVRYHLLNVM